MTSQVVPMPSPQGGGPATRSATQTSTLPTILGMYAFAGATFIVAAYMAHWYGKAQSAIVLFPLVLFFGVAEFYASTWAFRTGDHIAMAMHGTWGAFWTAFGILDLMYTLGTVSTPQAHFLKWASGLSRSPRSPGALPQPLARTGGITGLLVLLAIGATLEAIAELAGLGWLRMLAGYFLLASSIVAWCVATRQMVRFGRSEKTQPAIPVAQSASMRAAS